jgi:hypothetical protein
MVRRRRWPRHEVLPTLFEEIRGDAMKQWWKSKTIWMGVAAVVKAVADWYIAGDLNTDSLLLALFGVASVVLRPVSTKKLTR